MYLLESQCSPSYVRSKHVLKQYFIITDIFYVKKNIKLYPFSF